MGWCNWSARAPMTGLRCEVVVDAGARPGLLRPTGNNDERKVSMTMLLEVAGNLAAPPEPRFRDDGTLWARFRMASSVRRSGTDGMWNDVTTWLDVNVMDDQTAQWCIDKLGRGAGVKVVGDLVVSPWINHSGEPQSGLAVFAAEVSIHQGTRGGSRGAASAMPASNGAG